MNTRLAFIFLGFAAGNFTYQWLFNATPDWGVAVERSWFQGIIVLWIAFVEWSVNR